MRTWIKFYTEALHDRKMRRLDRFDKSVYYDLLLLAGFEDKDGYLPCIDDIAFELDLTVKQAKKSIQKLLEIGVISRDDNGNLYVTMFTQRQETSSDGYERVKRYRNKKRNAMITDDNVINDNGMITDDNVINDTQMITAEEEVEVEEEVDKEVEEEKKNTNVAKATLSCALSNSQNETLQKPEKKKTKSEKPIKEKLTPDQHEYWQFAKENAEMAEAFYKATKIAPSGKEFGRWVNDLRELAEAGITVEDMQKGVDYMHGQGITIGAPGSVLKTARWLKVNPQVAKATRGESWTERAERIASELGMNSFDYGNSLPKGDVIDL